MKKLGFGCMRLPLISEQNRAEVDLEHVNKMVDTFLENGFTYFDTAYMYHDFKSENIVKEALINRHPRDSFLLADKLPTMHLEVPEDMERIFNEQLEKTGAEYFDYYLVHSLGKDLYAVAERVGAFEFCMQKKKEGKIKRLGFSFHDSAEFLDKILTDHPEAEFVQLQINYLDWESEDVQSRKCYEVALKHNKEIIIMEPIRGGMLANLPPAAEKLFKETDSSMSIASWAIRFAASCDNVITVLSGMSNLEQMMDNLSYMQNFKPLTESEKELCLKAGKIVKEAVAVTCTSCRYCVDGCPKNISIPEYFTLYNKALKPENTCFEAEIEEYKKLLQNNGAPGDCIACGKCEGICPQHIKIIDSLKKVAENFKV